jgi:hypothetical protein
MSFEELERELGEPLTVKEVAQLLKLDERTVRKYYADLGGVWVASCLRFFTNEIRRVCDAHKNESKGEAALARRGEAERKDCSVKVVRQRKKGIPQGCSMGRGNQEVASGRGPAEDPHGLLKFIEVGK